MNVVAALTTSPRRTSYLRRTLRSLASAGFEDLLIAADAPQPGIESDYLVGIEGEFPRSRIIPSVERLGAYANWKRALRTSIDGAPGADGFAVFQDDIVVARNLRPWIDAHLWPDAVRSLGVVSLYTARPHQRAEEGWHRLAGHGCPDFSGGAGSRAFGALAYVFPYSSARALLDADPGEGRSAGIDGAVGEFCRQNRLAYWLHSPSLVEHVGEVSTLSDFGLTECRRAGRFLRDASQRRAVTAVLLNWKRRTNLPAILAALAGHAFIDEILIWNNDSTPLLPDLAGNLPQGIDVRVLESEVNVGTYGRYCAARQARNDIIFTQDDDYVVRNVERLFERFVRNGQRITAGLAEGHFQAEAHRRPWIQLGWGSFFRREWIGVLASWIDRYGEDELLYRKADRIFTTRYGLHDPQRADVLRLAGPDGRPSESDAHALWLRPDHVRLTADAVGRALAITGDLSRHAARSATAFPGRESAAGALPEREDPATAR